MSPIGYRRRNKVFQDVEDPEALDSGSHQRIGSRHRKCSGGREVSRLYRRLAVLEMVGSGDHRDAQRRPDWARDHVLFQSLAKSDARNLAVKLQMNRIRTDSGFGVPVTEEQRFA